MRIAKPSTGDRVKVTTTCGRTVVGVVALVNERQINVESQAAHQGTALAWAAVESIEQAPVAAPCGDFTGAGSRCETCRYRRAMH